MSDEEDYSSESDADYVPSDGEAVSEEENSGEEEDLGALREDAADIGEVAKKRKKKPAKKKDNLAAPRKRKGGIKLEGGEVGGQNGIEEDVPNKELVEQIAKEKELKKEIEEKKKADDLWSSFMSDVGRAPPKRASTGSTSLGSLASVCKPVSKPTEKSPSVTTSVKTGTPRAVEPQKITVTKVYDFAGEAVKVTKEVDASSKEGQAELKKQQEEKDGEEETAAKASPIGPTSGTTTGAVGAGGVKRPGGGLGGLLDKLNKKPKISTLEKSKLDWEHFKTKEGIGDELDIHNRGKQSYIERMAFLQRADHRQFEIEKNLRLSTSKR